MNTNVEEFIKKHKRVGTYKIAKFMNIKRKKARYLLHNNSNVQLCDPLLAGSMKHKIDAWKLT